MPSVVLSGAKIQLILNGSQYSAVQQVDYTLDYGETEIAGIDSLFPQEIATTAVRVYGSVRGLRIQGSGGLQALGLTPTIGNIARGVYISIRIRDRQTDEDILFIPRAKIVSEQSSVAAKGIMRVSFSFRGVAGLQPADRANPRSSS